MPDSCDRRNTISPTAYRGAVFHSLGGGAEEYAYYPNGLLLVGADGLITACGESTAIERRFDLSGYAMETLAAHQILLPGLIDLHVHLPQYNVRGRQANDLLNWLERHVFPEEAKFSDAAYARQASDAFFAALLENGTTTAGVFLTSHAGAAEIAFQSAKKTGNRVVMGLNLMDKGFGESAALTPLLGETDALLNASEALCRKWHNAENGRILYAWMPRFALNASEALLEGIGRLRQQYPDTYVHTHLSEQGGEIGAVLAQFPWASHYTNVYDHFGLLGERTILAHGIHLSDGELDCIAQCQAGVAHCPGSNFFLKSGRFPWQAAVEKKLRFGLGSDVGAGPDLSMFQAMRDAQYRQDHLPVPIALNTLFYRATLGAAAALHREDALGNFLPGKQADLIVVDLENAASFEDGPQIILSELVYLRSRQGMPVSRTVIGGQTVFQRQ